MIEPVVTVTFDLLAAAIALLGLLLAACGLVALTSCIWKRRLARLVPSITDEVTVRQVEDLLDGLSQGLLLANGQGHVVWSNPEARRLVSLEGEPLCLGGDLVPVVKRVVETQRTELHELHPTPDTALQLRVMPVPGIGSLGDKAVCAVADVSDRHRQQESYKSLIYHISHDLGTPLFAIAGHIANIRDCSIEEVDSWRTSQEVIDREVRWLTELTEKMLTLSRLESGDRLEREMINIKVALKSTHGQYVTAKGAEGDWFLRQQIEPDDGCEWFTLRHLENGKVALKTCYDRYVTAPRTGSTRRDFALVQERGLSKCGEFVRLDLDDGTVAFVTCAGRLVTAGDGYWDSGDEWLIVGQVECIGGWERFKVLRQ